MEGQAGFHFSPRPNRAAEIPWRQYSTQAFAAAAEAGRPILLSISAVWCHWCHVMDETTYSDPSVLELIRQRFLPIRVDRDQRPDVDHRYNLGGWPSTAFLTPEGEVLGGGTYINPGQMIDVASRIADYYSAHKEEISRRLAERERESGSLTDAGEAGPGAPEENLVQGVVSSLKAGYDREFGGFGREPKFPQAEALCLLAERSILSGDLELMSMAQHSLTAMASGGMYDQVEDGFYRYSTTRDFSVPHFEKMLEDHAGLIEALALSGQGEILDGAVRYLDRVLLDPESGLYGGSQDADERYYLGDAQSRAAITPPAVDRRLYVSWNAALAVAFALADSRLCRPQLRAAAERMVQELWSRARDGNGTMRHSDGSGGQLEDQVWMALALVRVGRDLEARELLSALQSGFGAGDPNWSALPDSADPDPAGRLRIQLTPMAENSVLAIALYELGELERARAILARIARPDHMEGPPGALCARALDRLAFEPGRITTLNPVLAAAALSIHPYLLHERSADDSAVLCFGTTCLMPVREPEEVVDLLRARLKGAREDGPQELTRGSHPIPWEGGVDTVPER